MSLISSSWYSLYSTKQARYSIYSTKQALYSVCTVQKNIGVDVTVQNKLSIYILQFSMYTRTILISFNLISDIPEIFPSVGKVHGSAGLRENAINN